MLSMSTLPRITACSVALEQLGTIFMYTLPLRLSNPKTMVFPPAPRPLFPLTRPAPKKLSSTSTSPDKGDSIAHFSAILSRIWSNYLLIVLRFKWVNGAILVASISSEKYFKISRNLLVEIRERFKTGSLFVMTGVQPVFDGFN